MSRQVPRVKFTYEDVLLFSEDGKRHEIIDGDHYPALSPSTRHQRISLRLATTFESFLRERRLGEVFEA